MEVKLTIDATPELLKALNALGAKGVTTPPLERAVAATAKTGAPENKNATTTVATKKTTKAEEPVEDTETEAVEASGDGPGLSEESAPCWEDCLQALRKVRDEVSPEAVNKILLAFKLKNIKELKDPKKFSAFLKECSNALGA